MIQQIRSDTRSAAVRGLLREVLICAVIFLLGFIAYTAVQLWWFAR